MDDSTKSEESESAMTVYRYFWVVCSCLVTSLVVLLVAAFYVIRRRKVTSASPAAGVRSRLGLTGAAQRSANEDDLWSWVGVLVGWACERQRLVPDGWMQAWVGQLNDQARKQSLTSTDDVTLRFEGLRHESTTSRDKCRMTSSQISHVTAEVISTNLLLLRVDLTLLNVGLSICLIHKRPDALSTVGCDVDVTSLRGQLHIQCEDSGSDVIAKVSFSVEPEMELQCRICNDQAGQRVVTSDEIEKIVRRAIARSVTTLHLAGGQAQTETLITATRSSTLQASCPTPAQTQSQFVDNVNKRLLVRVVKANGLEESADGSEPFCTISLDEPPQAYTTSPVKNTGNPFFDESFLFELNSSSRKITFQVRDRKRNKDKEFLGRADLVLNGHVTTGRQILPLQGQGRTGDVAYGSLTIELTEVDASYCLPSTLTPNNSPQQQQKSNGLHSATVDASPEIAIDRAINITTLNDHARSLPSRFPERSEVPSDPQGSKAQHSTRPPAGASSPRTVKRRSLGSAIRSRLNRALSAGRSRSADRATGEKTSALQPPPSSLTPPPGGVNQKQYRTSVELQISSSAGTAGGGGGPSGGVSCQSVDGETASHRSRSSSALRRIFRRRDKTDSSSSRDSSAESATRPRSAHVESSTPPSPRR